MLSLFHYHEHDPHVELSDPSVTLFNKEKGDHFNSFDTYTSFKKKS